MEKIGYLGPEGSYSFVAAAAMRPQAELIGYSSFPLVMNSLVSGATDGVIIPIENSLNGGVMQNIDLLQATRGVCAVEERIIKIDHRLATREGAALGGIRRIYSHSQALAQCAGYMFENFPEAELISTASTSASLDMIKGNEDAAIVGAHSHRSGLTLSENSVADDKNNFTHFLLVKRGVAPLVSSRRIFFSAECPNRPGALMDMLGLLYRHGINMTRLQSRPIKHSPEQYRFFIEIEGDYSSAATRAALRDIEVAVSSFRLLGCY